MNTFQLIKALSILAENGYTNVHSITPEDGSGNNFIITRPLGFSNEPKSFFVSFEGEQNIRVVQL